jgi:hypothetical protein
VVIKSRDKDTIVTGQGTVDGAAQQEGAGLERGLSLGNSSLLLLWEPSLLQSLVLSLYLDRERTRRWPADDNTVATKASPFTVAASAEAAATGTHVTGVCNLQQLVTKGSVQIAPHCLCLITLIYTRFWKATKALVKFVEFKSTRQNIHFIYGMVS